VQDRALGSGLCGSTLSRSSARQAQETDAVESGSRRAGAGPGLPMAAPTADRTAPRDSASSIHSLVAETASGGVQRGAAARAFRQVPHGVVDIHRGRSFPRPLSSSYPRTRGIDPSGSTGAGTTSRRTASRAPTGPSASNPVCRGPGDTSRRTSLSRRAGRTEARRWPRKRACRPASSLASSNV